MRCIYESALTRGFGFRETNEPSMGRGEETSDRSQDGRHSGLSRALGLALVVGIIVLDVEAAFLVCTHLWLVAWIIALLRPR